MTLIQKYNPLLKKSFQEINDTSELENSFAENNQFIIKKYEISNRYQINKFWDFGQGTREDASISRNYKNCIFKIENQDNELLFNDLLELKPKQTPFEALFEKCTDYFNETNSKLIITVYFNVKYKKLTRVESLNESLFALLRSDYGEYRGRNYHLKSDFYNFVSTFDAWSDCGVLPYIDTAICWITNRNEINIPFKHNSGFEFSRKNFVRVYDKAKKQFFYLNDIVKNLKFKAICTQTMIYSVNSASDFMMYQSNFRNDCFHDWFSASYVRVYEYRILSTNYYFFVVKPLGHDLFFIKNLPDPKIAEELGLRLYGYFYQDGNASPCVRDLSGLAFYSWNHYELRKSDILKVNYLINKRFNPNYIGKSTNFNKKMKFFVLDNSGNGSELSDLYIDVETFKTGYTVGLKLKTE